MGVRYPHCIVVCSDASHLNNHEACAPGPLNIRGGSDKDQAPTIGRKRDWLGEHTRCRRLCPRYQFQTLPDRVSSRRPSKGT